MAVFNSLTFDGENSLDYGVYITGEAVYNAPERSVDMVVIPGRNGTLALDQGRFENITVTYPAGTFGTSQSEFASLVSDYRNALVSRYKYARIEDDYHTDEFRLGLYKSGLEVDPVSMSRAGEFDIIFDCKPQRFLKSGETVITLTGTDTITNPTLFEAKPLLVVTGTGNLTVNGVQIAISETPTTIDCELMEAYNGTTSRNSDIVLTPNKFPVLKPGNNTITLGSGITKVEITPRWWRI